MRSTGKKPSGSLLETGAPRVYPRHGELLALIVCIAVFVLTAIGRERCGIERRLETG
jgi:hypothetical protein